MDRFREDRNTAAHDFCNDHGECDGKADGKRIKQGILVAENETVDELEFGKANDTDGYGNQNGNAEFFPDDFSDIHPDVTAYSSHISRASGSGVYDHFTRKRSYSPKRGGVSFTPLSASPEAHIIKKEPAALVYSSVLGYNKGKKSNRLKRLAFRIGFFPLIQRNGRSVCQRSGLFL